MVLLLLLKSINYLQSQNYKDLITVYSTSDVNHFDPDENNSSSSEIVVTPLIKSNGIILLKPDTVNQTEFQVTNRAVAKANDENCSIKVADVEYDKILALIL